MCSAHREKVALSRTIPWQSSILRNYQELWQGRQSQSPPSPLRNHELWRYIQTLTNRQFHMRLAVNIPLCHPASMISTFRPSLSMCWLLWSWFERMKTTASNHRSQPSRLQFRRPQWMWLPLKARRQRTRQRTTPLFWLTPSPDESIGIFLQATPLTPMSQETYLSLRSLPPHRRLHGDKKENWAWRCLFPQKGKSRSTPAGMRPTLTSQKKHPDAQEKVKHSILLTRF